MQSNGAYRPVDGPDQLMAGEVLVSGDPFAVEELSRRVKLGDAEIERRKKRRKIQKTSRRHNRG